MTASRRRGSFRIDLVLQEGPAADLTSAYDIVRDSGGATFRVGSYPGKRIGEKAICYLAVRARDPRVIARRLVKTGYKVLAVHA